MFGRRKIATIVAEFLGTGVLTLLTLSVLRSQLAVVFFIAIAAAVAYVMASFVFGRISGGYFNPALTLGLWTARKVSTFTAIVYVAAQLLGAWGAYYVFSYFAGTHYPPIGGKYSGKILVAEAVGTAIFALGWAAAHNYRRISSVATSTLSGLSYFVGILAASAASIGLLNPATALGVRAWVWTTYVLGPVLGAIIGTNIYYLLFADLEDIDENVDRSRRDAAVVRPSTSGNADNDTEIVTTKRRTTKRPTTAKRTTTKRRTTTRRRT